MSFVEYLLWFFVFGCFAIVFSYILVRAVSTAHYRSKAEYDRRRAWDNKGEKNDG